MYTGLNNSSASTQNGIRNSWENEHSGFENHQRYMRSSTGRQGSQINSPQYLYDDSSVARYLDKQGRHSDKLQMAIKASKETLADVEHKMLADEQELYNLNRIQKNPNQEDLKKLQAEVKVLQHSVQKLCHQTEQHPSRDVPKNTQMYNNYSSLTRPRQRSYEPALESPTTRLLRNPIDNSLVFSHEKY